MYFAEPSCAYEHIYRKYMHYYYYYYYYYYIIIILLLLLLLLKQVDLLLQYLSAAFSL